MGKRVGGIIEGLSLEDMTAGPICERHFFYFNFSGSHSERTIDLVVTSIASAIRYVEGRPSECAVCSVLVVGWSIEYWRERQESEMRTKSWRSGVAMGLLGGGFSLQVDGNVRRSVAFLRKVRD